MTAPGSPSLQLGLGRPCHGWLPVRLAVGGQVIEFEASDVPQDPVEALVDALALAARDVASTVWWHLEPDGYFFDFQPLPQVPGTCRLGVCFAPGSSRALAAEVASVSGDKTAILLPLWRALRQFQTLATDPLHWPPTTALTPSLQALREDLRSPRHAAVARHPAPAAPAPTRRRRSWE